MLIFCLFVHMLEGHVERNQLGSQKRKRRKPCWRCDNVEEWIGENWDERKHCFERLGERTCHTCSSKKSKKHQLTNLKCQALVSLFYDANGKCSLCASCFELFTGCSKFVWKSLTKLLSLHSCESLLLMKDYFLMGMPIIQTTLPHLYNILLRMYSCSMGLCCKIWLKIACFPLNLPLDEIKKSLFICIIWKWKWRGGERKEN